MFFALIFIPICVVCIPLIYSKLKYYYLLSESVKNVTGPKTFPFIGDLAFLRDIQDRIKAMDDLLKRQMTYKTWFGPQLLVVTSDPELIGKIFAAPQMLHRPHEIKVLRMPNGLVECDYKMWRIHRKIINPMFGSMSLQSFLPIFLTISNDLVTNLTTYVDGPDFDILEDVLDSGLKTVLRTMFGGNADGVSEEDHCRNVANVQTLTSLTETRLFNPWLYWDFVYHRTTRGQLERRTRKELQDYIHKLIEQRRKLYTSPVTDPNAEQKPQLFIDRLLAPEHHLTDAEVRDECFTMAAGGAETSSVTVCNAVLLLAMYPEVQEKLAADIAGFFERNETITADNINEIECLDMVVKETLRLFPAIPVTARGPIIDCDLGPFTLKPGTIVLINFLRMQRDVNVWGESAEQFNPERFAPENIATTHLQAFRPFGGGQRNCIGYRYATMSIKVMLICLVKSYKFSTKLKLNELIVRYVVSMRLLNKHLVAIEKR